MPTPLLILGTRLLAEEMYDLITEIPGYEVTAFVENLEKDRCDHQLEGLPIIWIDEVAKYAGTHLAICALSTTHRRDYVDQAAALGLRLATLIHPTARVSKRATLAPGCFVSSNVSIATRATLGKCVFVNRNASIGHHTTIGDYCSIQPNATIAGVVSIGADTYVGMGAIIIERKTIGRGCLIAAGALITTDLPDRVCAMGLPAKITKTNIDPR